MLGSNEVLPSEEALEPEVAPGPGGTAEDRSLADNTDLQGIGDPDLERRKLVAEIRSLELDVRSKDRVEADLGRSRFLEVAAAVVPAIAVAGSVLLGVATFAWDMRKDREFRVTQEMVQLVRDLSDPDESRQHTAAIALALLGEPALSILIANLAIDHTDDVYDGIEQSIADILEQESSPALVERSVAELGELLSAQLAKPNVPDRSVAALVRALTVVGAGQLDVAIETLADASIQLERAVKEGRLMETLADPVRLGLESSLAELTRNR